MLRDIILSPIRSLTRISSFINKEMIEVLRRPGALFSLVIAPFLIMAAFGAGYRGERRAMNAVVVAPADSTIKPETYQQMGSNAVNVVEITADLEGARTRLKNQEIDLLVIAPADLSVEFAAGRQTPISVEYNELDPVLDGYIRYIADRQVHELNRQLVQDAVEAGQQYVVDTVNGTDLRRLPPNVVAAPTLSVVKNWAPTAPAVVTYFAPAVLALIIQHLAITLTALSLVRERHSGVFELFRVAPVNVAEILLGKYLALTILSGIVASVITGLLVYGIGVPFLGTVSMLALVIGGLIIASLGFGLLISTIADSERQAVQLAMLVLLASVFFSGFVLPLKEFWDPFQYAAWVLPVTHGIRLLQDVMLRGTTTADMQIVALYVIAAVLFLLTTILLHQQLRRT